MGKSHPKTHHQHGQVATPKSRPPHQQLQHDFASDSQAGPQSSWKKTAELQTWPGRQEQGELAAQTWDESWHSRNSPCARTEQDLKKSKGLQLAEKLF